MRIFPGYILASAILLALVLYEQEAIAAAGMRVIRDTEIEKTLKGWSEPIAKAAGINHEALNIILVQNDQINAFVAGGQNIFIYTGLLEKTETPGEVAGVIAHELGHIRSGHLIRMRRAYEKASYESLLGALLGIGVAIATGEGGAGAAVTAGSQSMAARRFFSHSRIQESSADQAALSFLKEAGISSEGLLSFLSKLEDQDILPQSQQSEYIRTHPLSRNRIDALKRHADSVPGTRDPYPRQWDSEHARMKAKLMGFLRPQQVIWYYDENENSVSSLYAHAIAAYRQSKIKKSLNLVNKLLAKEPKNPYFLELKAQMLKDYGNLKEAIIFYEKALDNIERAPLIEIDLAHSLIESSAGNKKVLKKAVSLLKKAETRETRSTRIHRLLATAYGRMGLETKATLQLAEEALLQGKIDYARNLASRTKNHLEPGTKEYLRAVDILNFIENEESD